MPYLSNLERGAYRHPAPDRLVALGDLLGIPAQRIDYLAAGDLTSRLPELRVYLHAKCGELRSAGGPADPGGAQRRVRPSEAGRRRSVRSEAKPAGAHAGRAYTEPRTEPRAVG